MKHLSVLTAACLAATPVLAQDSSDPIKLTLHDWSGQLITTTLMGEVLKEAGNNVEYVQADYIAQFAGLKTGDLHLAMEIWETTGREALDEAVGSGNVVNMGQTGMAACYNDASVGMNPDAAYDCGKPTGPIWKAAWAGLPDQWPNATKVVENFKISNEDMGAMVADADLNGKSVEEVVAAWMAENEATWKSWIAQ